MNRRESHRKKNNLVRFQHAQGEQGFNTEVGFNDIHSSKKIVSSLKQFQSAENTEQAEKTNCQGQHIVKMAYEFLRMLMMDSEFYEQLLKSVKFEDLSKQSQNLYEKAVSYKKSIANLSKKFSVSKKTISNSKPIISSFKKQKEKTPYGSNYRRISKKVSIFAMVDGEIQSSDDQSQYDSDLESDTIFQTKNVIRGQKQIRKPSFQFTQELVTKIFAIPSLFVINLSICLLLKYCYETKTKLKLDNVSWLLAISGFVAYKIYFDEPIDNLLQYFEDQLNITKKDIIDLQRVFMDGIDYRSIISGAQYQYVVAKMLESEKQNKISNHA